MTRREATRRVMVGKVPVGGGAPVAVQSMANADPHDAEALLAQIGRVAAAGCDIFRLTVNDEAAAAVFGEVRRRSPLPIVADIHFDWRLALSALAAGADALRLNPGNIGGADKVRAVARAAKARGVPIRIGVNLGSLERELDAEVRAGRLAAPEALVRSALGHAALLEAEDFRDIVISAKASSVAGTLAAYRLLAERTTYPLHLGVTEAGTALPGTVRSSVAMGILLAEGIGDTLRVSLTDTPEREVRTGAEILRALGLRPEGPSIVSCPTCGRTRVDLFAAARAVEDALEAHWRAHPGWRAPRVAVMGCAVNGPGEAKGAEVALCGGDGEFLLYVRGEAVGKVSEAEAAGKVMEHVLAL